MPANFTENEGTRIVYESIAILELIMTAILFVIMSLGLITYLVWTVILIKTMIKPKREEECETEKGNTISIQGKKGKFLLCVMIFEILTITFYDVAAVLGYVLWEFPEFRVFGIRWNTSCTSEIADYISWLEELQFPEVSFFICLGRSNLLITIALATSFIQFVTNSYVTQSWKYKNIFKGVWFVIPLCILTVVFGTISQTMVIMWAVNIVVLAIYFGISLRTVMFLNKALTWREQDLKCYNEREDLWRHRRVASRFRVSMRLIMVGLAVLTVSGRCPDKEISETMIF